MADKLIFLMPVDLSLQSTAVNVLRIKILEARLHGVSTPHSTTSIFKLYIAPPKFL